MYPKHEAIPPECLSREANAALVTMCRGISRIMRQHRGQPGVERFFRLLAEMERKEEERHAAAD